MYNAVFHSLKDLHPKSITFDNGAEFAKFRELEAALNATIYFADPHSPWQRGTISMTYFASISQRVVILKRSLRMILIMLLT